MIYVNTKVERVSLELAKMSFQSHEPKLDQFYKELSFVKQKSGLNRQTDRQRVKSERHHFRSIKHGGR